MRYVFLLLTLLLTSFSSTAAPPPLHKEIVLGWELDVSPKGFIVKDGWVGPLLLSFATNTIVLVKVTSKNELLMMSSGAKGQMASPDSRSFVLRAEMDCKAFKIRIVEGILYNGYFATGGEKAKAPYPYPIWQTPAKKSMPWYALDFACPKDGQ